MTCNFHCLLEEQKHHWIIFTTTKEGRNSTGSKVYTAICAVKHSSSIEDLHSFRKSVFPSLTWISVCALALPACYQKGTQIVLEAVSLISVICQGKSSASPLKSLGLIVGFCKLTKLCWQLLTHASLTLMICPTEIPADVMPKSNRVHL